MSTFYCPHHKDATWVAQWMNGPDNPPMFTFVGSHFRGFSMVKMCSTCKEKVQAGGTISIQRIGLWFDLKAGQRPAVRISGPPEFHVEVAA